MSSGLSERVLGLMVACARLDDAERLLEQAARDLTRSGWTHEMAAHWLSLAHGCTDLRRQLESALNDSNKDGSEPRKRGGETP